MHDLQWFIDRIGARVYREKLNCTCNTCQKSSVYIRDKEHAEYLYTISVDMGILYRDSKQDIIYMLVIDTNFHIRGIMQDFSSCIFLLCYTKSTSNSLVMCLRRLHYIVAKVLYNMLVTSAILESTWLGDTYTLFQECIQATLIETLCMPRTR